jgi:hypothetical protein
LKDALQELKDNNNCGLAPQHQVNPKKYPKNKIEKNLQVGSWDIFAFIFWFDRDMTIAISSVLKRENLNQRTARVGSIIRARSTREKTTAAGPARNRAEDTRR